MRKAAFIQGLTLGTAVAAQQPNPRQQPGAMVHIYAPGQHDRHNYLIFNDL
jgi:hypothetical protein